MNFELTDEQQRIRDAVREFAEAEDRSGSGRSGEEAGVPRGSCASSRRWGSGMMVPEEFGGAGADALSFILVVEGWRACAPRRPSSSR
jgi:alkylation response protein AidB-like acyl-CoA dehydrogenase